MTAIVTTEPSAPAYALRSPIAKLLLTDEARGVIAPLIPHGVSYDQVIGEVYRATIQTPDIKDCTPASIIMAVSSAVQTGLIIGKTIHLVPVSQKGEKRLQAWLGYTGAIELVLGAGGARAIDAQAVYANDKFEYQLGDTPGIMHAPALTDRGALIAAYAIAWLNTSGSLRRIVVLPLADIEKVRKVSKQWSPEKVATCPDWYAVKTAVHRLCKLLPKNARLARVVDLLDQQEQSDRDEDAIDISDMVEYQGEEG